MQETVGVRIEALARERGLPEGEALATRIGVTYETLRKWRTGESAPNRSRQKRLSALLAVPAAAFMHGVEMGSVAHAASHSQATISPMDDIEPTNLIRIPVLSASASMGSGADQGEDVVIGRLALSQTWIGQTIKPITTAENLRFIHGYGDSMSPTFNDGDVLLVDGGVRSVRVDGVYVLEAQGRLYIKRVRQRMDGSYEISSDNLTVKTVDVLAGNHQVEVLGKVVWIWNGKKV